MRKLLIALLLVLFASITYSQSVEDVTWAVENNCTASFGRTGSQDMKKILPEQDIDINIDIEKEKILSLFAWISESDSVEVSQEIQSIDDGSSMIKIKAQGIDEIKMKIGGNVAVIPYPYRLKIWFGDTTCELVIGDAENQKSAESVITAGTNLNLLRGIQSSSPVFDLKSVKSETGNAMLIMDCGNIHSVQTALYRFKKKKGKNEPRKVKYLRYGDHLSIYLINFNPYLYQVVLDNRQLDFSYAEGGTLFDIPAQDTSKEKPAQSSGTGNQSPTDQLLQYAAAVEQIEGFIQAVKRNESPNSDVLEFNKATILENIQSYNLGTGTEITILYKSLDDQDQKKYKTIYETALQFNQKRLEFIALSYTVKLDLAPIQVKSYDKLVFDLEFKNTQSGTVSPKKEYEYLIVGGWQINQSFGVAGHGLFDDELSLLPVPTRDTVFATNNGRRLVTEGPDGMSVDSISAINDIVKQQIIEDKSSSRIPLSATTLTHLYYRGGRWGFGAALGIGIDFFPKTNVRYLAGGSIMLLDGRHRISLDIGCAFGKVSVLAANQQVGDILGPSATSPNLVEKSRRSLFLGISWNVPLAPKKEQKAGQ